MASAEQCVHKDVQNVEVSRAGVPSASNDGTNRSTLRSATLATGDDGFVRGLFTGQRKRWGYTSSGLICSLGKMGLAIAVDYAASLT